MRVRYYAEEDVLLLIASPKGGGGGTLRDDFRVIFAIDGEDEGDENITRVDILDVSRFLPLRAERGYDADTDTLTLGDKPERGADYRVVDNGDFVSYRQWFDDGSEWDVVAVDLRRASVHLAPALAARSRPMPVGGGITGNAGSSVIIMVSEYNPGTARSLSRLIDELNRLPGIGPKSAQRIADHVIRLPGEEAQITG